MPIHRPVVLAALLAALVAAPAPARAEPVAAAPEDYGRMMLLLDSSGSMAEPAGGGQTKIAAARQALQGVVGSLPDEASVGLRVFGAKVFSRDDPGSCEDSQVVVPPGTDNRPALEAAVGDYEPYGETPIPFALRQAAKDLGGEGARSIVLVSDGESTCEPDPCEVAAELVEQGIDLQIDVVGLSVSGAARDQLECIADRGNGTYYDADDAGEIEEQLERVATRAVRPFVLTGTPVVGGPADAPAPVEVGDYTDTIGSPGEVKHYVFTRTTEGSTLRVAALTQGQSTLSDGLTMEVEGPDGRCDFASVGRSLDVREVISARVTAGPESRPMSSDGCDAPGDYVISVERARGATEEVPLGLSVSEEPPVDDPGLDVGAVAPDLSTPRAPGAAQPVVGGASFGNAPEIGPGTWRSDVVPGEALMYRVPLTFGQALKVSVDLEAPSGAAADELGPRLPNAHLAVYDPMGAQLGYPRGATFLDYPGDATLGTATPPVSLTSTGVRSDQFNGGADLTMAGSYYVGVSMQRADATVVVPFTLTVEVVGEPADPPVYADGATWTVEGGLVAAEPADEPSVAPSDENSSAPDAAREPAADDDGGSGLAVGLGVGVLVLLAVGAGVVLLRRRSAG
ncbi:VWA domain-containing protein [Nocardioides sp. C4-1]|uniref:vWA domain-containing protein n=1 Tax=Nocardioides sp. C4-1 TaxID=3151851 RepID=UPI0032639E8B